MPTNRDHPAFVRDCQTVEREGACGYMTPGRPTEYQLMLPNPITGGGTVFTGMPIGNPAQAMVRIRMALRTAASPGPFARCA